MNIKDNPAIFFCGDPHGQFDAIIDAVIQHRPQAIVLLGDQEATRPLHEELSEIRHLVEIWWIHGNHDTDSATFHDNLFSSELSDRCLHRRVVDIAGVRIAGLGGVFRTRIWDQLACGGKGTPDAFMRTLGKGNLWRGGLPLRHRSTIFPSDIAMLMKERADILVTHEAPTPHAFGSKVIADLAAAMRVSKAFHGHHHEDLQYDGEVWQGVGMRGIKMLDGTIVRPGHRGYVR